jgi:hypothetical protein
VAFLKGLGGCFRFSVEQVKLPLIFLSGFLGPALASKRVQIGRAPKCNSLHIDGLGNLHEKVFDDVKRRGLCLQAQMESNYSIGIIDAMMPLLIFPITLCWLRSSFALRTICAAVFLRTVLMQGKYCIRYR